MDFESIKIIKDFRNLLKTLETFKVGLNLLPYSIVVNLLAKGRKVIALK